MWNLRFGDDQYNNVPGLFYVPVETAADVRDAMDLLDVHFAEFGDYWRDDPGVLDESDT